MISLTWIPELLRGAVWIYLLLWASMVALALWLPPTLGYKLATTVMALAVGGALPAYFALSIKRTNDEQRPIVEERKARYAAAMARFEERCKSAGEKVYRTVEDVEGVLLLNVRPRKTPSVYADAYWSDAAMPDESSGDDYVRMFLYWEQRNDDRVSRGYLNYSHSEFPGYRFVDVMAANGGFERVRLEKAESTKLISEALKSKPARYAISFENFIDPEDRKLWVAGTKVTITDTSNNEVLAEKTWYVVEPGQGNTSGFRSPWAFAKSCPAHLGRSNGQTRFFVDQVLKPKKGA